MENLKSIKDKNWADMEQIIEKIVKENPDDEKAIGDITIMKQQFTLFLNEVVGPKDLIEISELSKQYKLGASTFSRFNGDIEDEGRSLKKFHEIRPHHYVTYYWEFFNLNYTSIVENYFTIDLHPEPFYTSINNFTLQSNPLTNSTWRPFVRLNFDFHHPHGEQNIYNSILIGSSFLNVERQKSYRFEKDFFGRLDYKYSDYLEKTDLFIIFGSSLSISDYYWWEKIVDVMQKKRNASC